MVVRVVVTATAKSLACLRPILRSCALGHSPPCHGYQLHAALVKDGVLPTSIPPNISSALFHMYTAIGPALSALRSFQEIPFLARSTPDWTALISCHARLALPFRALLLFRSMRRAGLPPDEVALIALLSASASLADPAAGVAAHVLFLKLPIPFTAPARNASMNMYSKCGLMANARRLFGEMPTPSVVSWTIIVTGALRAEGLSSALQLFNEMPQKNEVAWTAIISGYVEAGLPREALSLLAQMLFHDISVGSLNHISMRSLLSACSQAGDLTVGRWVHTHFLKAATFDDEDHLLTVNAALMDMYAKCGRVDTAGALFETMTQKNVVAWNVMLSGLSMHGMGAEVLRLFSRMVVEEELRPDDITLVSVLSACSRSGLLVEGRELFHKLGPVYGLTPKVEHYACMVDLFGRAGHFEEAEAIIRDMPVPPNEVVLGSLLASCSLHGKVELGRQLMRNILEMHPGNTEHHVLLANLYAASRRTSEANNARHVLRKSGVQKAPGVSYIEINGTVHHFCAGDRSHPQTRELYAMLDEMVWRLRLAGYAPDAASQHSRVEDNYLENGDEREEREQALLVHSERLAVALGLISTRAGLPLRIFKNLRICSDCHSVMKLVSEIYERQIIVRDRNRFHYFKRGVCSCSDYW